MFNYRAQKWPNGTARIRLPVHAAAAATAAAAAAFPRQSILHLVISATANGTFYRFSVPSRNRRKSPPTRTTMIEMMKRTKSQFDGAAARRRIFVNRSGIRRPNTSLKFVDVLSLFTIFMC